MNYQKINNLLGWLSFTIALGVYILTLEPTTSFWDCGEYIATAYKLQVGHPPGAPTYLLLGNFFSNFAFGDVTKVAYMINLLSATCSAFTILFLFWTITAFGKKILGKVEADGQLFSIMGAGLVGALAYTFSDSFWFSAVEGEVYGVSSFFTAIVFWAALKWDEEYDKDGDGANRWYHVVVREGRKREVRRLWEALDFKVSRLIRIRFGEIRLPDNLRANDSEYLKPKQVQSLLNSVKLKA